MPPGVRQGMVDLGNANEAAIHRLASCFTGADRTLAGLAYQAAWVATNFTEHDATAAKRLAGLVDRSSAEVPPPPDPAARDPRFESPVGPR